MLASITQNGANGIGKALMAAEPRGPGTSPISDAHLFSVTGVIRYKRFKESFI